MTLEERYLDFMKSRGYDFHNYRGGNTDAHSAFFAGAAAMAEIFAANPVRVVIQHSADGSAGGALKYGGAAGPPAVFGVGAAGETVTIK